MAVLVKLDQFVFAMNIENQRGAEHQKADAHEPRQQRDEKPVQKVGRQLALAPPRLAWIARRPAAQKGERQRQTDRDRNDLEHGLAGDVNNGQEFGEHASNLQH